jgi:competence protein ComEA
LIGGTDTAACAALAPAAEHTPSPVALTEGEVRALLASTLLVLIAAVGRELLAPPPARVGAVGLSGGDVDSAHAAAESLYADARRRRAPLAAGERVDINAADEAELDRLPGIGPALARAIVSARQSSGPFRSLQDLERVPGLGSRTIRRLAPHLGLPAARAGHGAVEPRWPRPAKVNLNRASVEELQALPGVGPVRAQAIVRWREERGRFRILEDLLEVPGIGPATLERLRAAVVVGS